MTLRLRIRKVEERLEHVGAGKKLQTIVFLCHSDTPTPAQSEAALADYKTRHPGWEAEDLVEITVN